MNQAVPVPPTNQPQKAPPKAAPRIRSNRADQEFLPAALEILERPPSPVGIALIAGIGILALLTLVWAYFGWIDVVAVAQGKIQPTGRVKIIQPLETGKVVTLNVQNGQHVEPGSILVELDNSDAAADEMASATALKSFLGEAARRRTAIANVEAGDIFATTKINWAKEDPEGKIPAGIRQREERVLSSELGQLAANIGSLSAQLDAKQREQASLADTIAAQSRLITLLQERVSIRADLVDKQSGTKASLLDAKESVLTQQTSQSVQKGQLAAAAGAVEVLESDIHKTRGIFIAESSQKLLDVERQTDEYTQKLVKAHVRMIHMALLSPISGTVQASSLTTIGQVVTTSEELMRIVPDGGEVEVEAYLPNKDVGFVRAGQEAIVKVESLPFTRYGTILASVTRVATDAIPEPDANIAEGNPSKAAKSTGFSQRTQNLVFPITLRLKETQIIADGVPVTLSAGMTVSVEVQTGKRRILEYLFSPLVEVSSEAMRER